MVFDDVPCSASVSVHPRLHIWQARAMLRAVNRDSGPFFLNLGDRRDRGVWGEGEEFVSSTYRTP